MRLYQISSAELDRIHFKLVGRCINHSLDEEVGYLRSETAIGSLLALVGQCSDQVHPNTVDPIWSRHLGHRIAVMTRAELEVSAIIVDDPESQRQQSAIALHRQLSVVAPITAMRIGVEEVVEAILDHFHRSAGRPRQRAGERNMLMSEDLRPKTTAGNGRNDLQVRRRNLEGSGNDEIDDIVEARIGVTRKPLGTLIEFGNGTHCLDWSASRPRPFDLTPHYQIRSGEIFVDRTKHEFLVEAAIGWPTVGVDHRIARRMDRFLRVGVHWKQFVLDDDEIQRVLGDIRILGHHCGDDFADMTDLVDRHAVLNRRRTREARNGPRLLRRVLRRKHGDNSRQCFSLAGIYRNDASVSMRAPQYGGVRHVRQSDVVDIFAFAGQQTRVFDPLHILADPFQSGSRLFALLAWRNHMIFEVRGHAATPCGRIFWAATMMALTMF